ncbi:MAG: hypothetical protein U0Y82_03010 [Thermoleophilia bacterium]
MPTEPWITSAATRESWVSRGVNIMASHLLPSSVSSSSRRVMMRRSSCPNRGWRRRTWGRRGGW